MKALIAINYLKNLYFPSENLNEDNANIQV